MWIRNKISKLMNVPTIFIDKFKIFLIKLKLVVFIFDVTNAIVKRRQIIFVMFTIFKVWRIVFMTLTQNTTARTRFPT